MHENTAAHANTVTATNPNWPQLERLRPRLHSHIQIYPQQFRGEAWYILHDKSSGRHLRFNASAYSFIAMIDGDHSVGEIHQLLQRKLGDTAPSADDISIIMSQLLNIEAVRSASTSTEHIFDRYKRNRRQKKQRAMANPLAIKAPLFDPDKLLNRLMPFVKPCFTPAAGCVWLFAVLSACLLALSNFSSLSAAVNSDIFAPGNIVAMALLFVLIKVVHEFAHAFTVKMWGGEVHEMGITLLVLMPIPYVDASAAASFRDKNKRMLVSAAGIAAELFIASIALFIWLSVEPGLIKDAALNTLLIASISTLLFNANPLLRFDGYYVLQDFVEIPNLYSRAGKYYLYLIQRYLFGLASARSPVTAIGERRWFATYGLAAFIYRFVILFAIVMFLAEEYLVVGVALGCWAIIMQVLLPLGKGMRYLQSSPALEGRRKRAIQVSSGMAAVIFALLLLAPAPLTTQSEGVLWVAEQAEVYSTNDGFVAELLVAPGETVEAGEPVIKLSNSALLAKLAVTHAKYRELEIQSASEQRKSPVKRQIVEHQMNSVEAELKLLEKRASSLLIRSETNGIFTPANRNALPGRYFKQGELIGYVVSPEHLIVKAILSQSEIGLLARGDSSARVRFAERINDVVEASIDQHTPSGKTRLPSAALGASGGGSVAVSRADASGLTAIEKIFELELNLPADLPPLAGIGERAYVRFHHGYEPLALQWWRSGRQLLLSRLDV